MDPYEVLGVAPDATDDELRSAYRRLVRALHPDTRAADVDAAVADEALRRVHAAWRSVRSDETDGGAFDRTERVHHRARRFPWWVVAIAVLVVIFIVTAYAGSVPPSPTAR